IRSAIWAVSEATAAVRARSGSSLAWLLGGGGSATGCEPGPSLGGSPARSEESGGPADRLIVLLLRAARQRGWWSTRRPPVQVGVKLRAQPLNLEEEFHML